jgi:choline dehydrogenase-like flavoprotein
MDHHKGISANADVEGFEDSYYYGRRPTSIYIPRFKNITSQEKNFLRGFHFGGSAYRNRTSSEHPIGKEFKDDITEAGKWQMGMYAFGECLPYSDNRITLNKDKKDDWGRPMLNIDCEFKENEKAMSADMAATAKEFLEAAGYSNIRVHAQITFPGNANHEMGTARMGNDPKTSVLNAHNQLHDVKNVFITDGSCMASSSCVNPSLTFMALTARACDYAVKQLQKRSI